MYCSLRHRPLFLFQGFPDVRRNFFFFSASLCSISVYVFISLFPACHCRELSVFAPSFLLCYHAPRTTTPVLLLPLGSIQHSLGRYGFQTSARSPVSRPTPQFVHQSGWTQLFVCLRRLLRPVASNRTTQSPLRPPSLRPTLWFPHCLLPRTSCKRIPKSGHHFFMRHRPPSWK